jgi:hypothetical protein
MIDLATTEPDTTLTERYGIFVHADSDTCDIYERNTGTIVRANVPLASAARVCAELGAQHDEH